MVNPSEIDQLKQFGLFAAPLNNGCWMVGKANIIYRLTVEDDHYKNEEISIAPLLAQAIEKWVKKRNEG